MTSDSDQQSDKQQIEAIARKVVQDLARSLGLPHDFDLEVKFGKPEAAVERRDEPMAMTDREIDAKFEAAEARTDTKIARLEGKLDLTLEKIGHLADDVRVGRSEASANRNLILGTLVAGLIAVFFGLFAVLQWSDARMFGMIQLRDSSKAAGAEAQATTAAKPPAETPRPSSTPQQ